MQKNVEVAAQCVPVRQRDLRAKGVPDNMRNSLLALVMVIAFCLGFQGNAAAADQDKAAPAQGTVSSEQGEVPSGEVMKRTEQAVNAAKDYTMEQKQEYEKKIESQFADLTKRIDDLKQKAQSAQQSVSDKLQGTLDELIKSQKAVEKKLPGLRDSTSQAWGEVKDGVDKAMTDLSQAYEKARSHFK
ncbi:MAG: hypothetical protein HY914_02280 [Desulfomonile tiedjei]|nr:hypothetical protein [Desulfomonile tiedjei]